MSKRLVDDDAAVSAAKRTMSVPGAVPEPAFGDEPVPCDEPMSSVEPVPSAEPAPSAELVPKLNGDVVGVIAQFCDAATFSALLRTCRDYAKELTKPHHVAEAKQRYASKREVWDDETVTVSHYLPNGTKHGLEHVYKLDDHIILSSPNLAWVHNYQDGKICGESLFYNGHDTCVVPYKNGKIHGTAISRHNDTGLVMEETVYVKGLKKEKRKWAHDVYDTMEEEIFHARNGSRTENTYRKGKLVSTRQYVCFKKTCATFFDEDGTTTVIPYLGGQVHGERTTRLESTGALLERTPMADGRKHGTEERWNRAGQLVLRCVWENGCHEGLEERWNDAGQLVFQCLWSDDERIGDAKVWNNNGVLVSLIPYKEGKRDGVQKSWDNSGALIRTVEWNEGVMDGSETEFDPLTGKEIVSRDWTNGNEF